MFGEYISALNHDAVSLAKMLRHDIPNAPMLHWVLWIRLFDFEMKHVPATSFEMEDALSRAPPVESLLPGAAADVDRFLDTYEVSLLSLPTRSLSLPALSLSVSYVLDWLVLTHLLPHLNICLMSHKSCIVAHSLLSHLRHALPPPLRCSLHHLHPFLTRLCSLEYRHVAILASWSSTCGSLCRRCPSPLPLGTGHWNATCMQWTTSTQH